MKRLLALSLLALLAFPAVALAALPKFPSDSIVVGKSIGGVALGMSASKAVSKWGSESSCKPSTGVCGWNTPSINTFQSAELFFGHGKVVGIEVFTYTNSQSQPVCKGPLGKLKTKKGIGLCSTEHQIRRDYPTATSVGDQLVLGSGRSKLVFVFSGLSHRVATIEFGHV